MQLCYDGKTGKGGKGCIALGIHYASCALCLHTHPQHPSWSQLCRLMLLGTQAIRD